VCNANAKGLGWTDAWIGRGRHAAMLVGATQNPGRIQKEGPSSRLAVIFGG
jgi:hypothetical protein